MAATEQEFFVIARFRGLDYGEAGRLINTHKMYPQVGFLSIRTRPNGETVTATRSPNRHKNHGMEDGLANLRRDMVVANEVVIFKGKLTPTLLRRLQTTNAQTR